MILRPRNPGGKRDYLRAGKTVTM
ncbi:MAG: hypothetical protein JWL84_4799, partial [Rhodospirillales bacterium]|nr:hypothetical protein [Rhodospirillales bacterium]